MVKSCSTCQHGLVTTITNHAPFTHEGREYPAETVKLYECHYNAPLGHSYGWPRVYARDFCSKYSAKGPDNVPVYRPESAPGRFP